MKKQRMNLRLFDIMTTTTETLSAEMKIFYDDVLLDNAKPNLVHDQFGQKRPIPKNGGKEIEFRRYKTLPKALAALTEGVTPDPNKMSVTTVTAKVKQYGDWISLSDVLLLTAIDNNLTEAVVLLGDQSGRTLDTITREVINGGTNVLYAPAGATPVTTRAGIKANSLMSLQLIMKAAAILKGANTVPFDKSYVAIVHPYVAYDLMQDEKWVADDAALSMLQEQSAWAMLLNEDGDVVWQQNLPEKLPRSYTSAEVASFSRWYLEDYPVKIWTRADGNLMVVGYQPGTLVKYYFSLEWPYMGVMLGGIAAVFIINLLLIVFLILRNTRKVERAMTPILQGIQNLSHGKASHLEEQGELAEVGLGNFRTVDVEDLSKHKMDSEQFFVTDEAAEAVNAAKRAGHRVAAIGTTVMRTIETAVSTNGMIKPMAGWVHGG